MRQSVERLAIGRRWLSHVLVLFWVSVRHVCCPVAVVVLWNNGKFPRPVNVNCLFGAFGSCSANPRFGRIDAFGDRNSDRVPWPSFMTNKDYEADDNSLAFPGPRCTLSIIGSCSFVGGAFPASHVYGAFQGLGLARRIPSCTVTMRSTARKASWKRELSFHSAVSGCAQLNRDSRPAVISVIDTMVDVLYNYNCSIHMPKHQ